MTQKRILIYTKATDYRHASQTDAADYFERLCREYGFQSLVSDDSSLLEGSGATDFDAIILVSNSGDIFRIEEETISRHIDLGKGVLGVHACLASFLDSTDPEGGTLMTAKNSIITNIFGTHFSNHPKPQVAEVSLAPHVLSEINLDGQFWHFDEYFNYSLNPSDNPSIDIIACVNENTYEGGRMGEQHPVVWRRNLGINRAPIYYCALGHYPEFYTDDDTNIGTRFLRHGFEFVCGIC